MAIARDNIITPQDAVDAAPLRESHEAGVTESELKAVFLDMLGTYIRPAELNVRTLGMPAITPTFEAFERAVKADGLSLYRKADENAMRLVYEAWHARNPKRGLGMLKAYLQALWPNKWTCYQMWQDKAVAYPDKLVTADGGNHYLTSRVEVEIDADLIDGQYLSQIGGALRSAVPARIVLSVRSTTQFVDEIALVPAWANVATIRYYEGTASGTDYPLVSFSENQPLAAGARALTVAYFEGAAEGTELGFDVSPGGATVNFSTAIQTLEGDAS